jgi:hypothetical protein
MDFLSAWRVFIDLQIFFTFGKYCNRVKEVISYTGSFVLALIVEKLSNESFLAVAGNVAKDLVDGNQEDLNVLAVIGTFVEGDQEDANKWFECNNGNVMTSIAMTFGDEKFNQEDAIEMSDNNNADDLSTPILVSYHYLLPASPSLALKVFLFLVLFLLSFYLLLA